MASLHQGTPKPNSDLTNPTSTSLTSLFPSPSSPFPFLSLPSEIRNLIYSTLYTQSRLRPPEYRHPDFLIHGDGPRQGGIQWTNIPSYPLLLVNQQTRRESLAIISPLTSFAIKTYDDNDTSAWNALQVLRRSAALCSHAARIFIDLTPAADRLRAMDMPMRLCRRVFEIVRILDGYERLRELTLRILVSSLMERELEEVQGFLRLTRKEGVSLLLELGIEESQWLSRRELREEQRTYERQIQELTRRFGGKKAEVWIEWTTLEQID